MAGSFSHSLSCLVAAQVCESFGFHSAQQSAVDALSEIMTKYISAIGDASHSYAEHAGRSEVNLADMLLALDDVGADVNDLVRFADFATEATLSQPVPEFPQKKKSKVSAPSFERMGEAPLHESIPVWLPAFPDSHTYVEAPEFEERRGNAREEALVEGKERRRAEKALVALHMRVAAVTSGVQREEAEPVARWGEWLQSSSALFDSAAAGSIGTSHKAAASGEDDIGQGIAIRKGDNQQQWVALESGRRKGLGAERGGSFHGMPTATDVIAPLLELTGRDEDGGEEELFKGDLQEREVKDGWTGWKERKAADICTRPLLTFDLGSKIQAKAEYARAAASLPGRSRGERHGVRVESSRSRKSAARERVKEEEKDENRSRAEQIFEAAEKGDLEAAEGR